MKPDTILLGDNKLICECRVDSRTVGFTRLNRVTEVMSRNYSGSMIRIKASGILPFETTPEQPILTRSSVSRDEKIISFSEPSWKEAKDLREKTLGIDGDYLLLPRKKGTYDKESIDFQEFIKERDINMVKAKRVPFSLPINEESSWLFGLYVAEGSSTVNGPQFDLNINEGEIEEK